MQARQKAYYVALKPPPIRLAQTVEEEFSESILITNPRKCQYALDYWAEECPAVNTREEIDEAVSEIKTSSLERGSSAEDRPNLRDGRLSANYDVGFINYAHRHGFLVMGIRLADIQLLFLRLHYRRAVILLPTAREMLGENLPGGWIQETDRGGLPIVHKKDYARSKRYSLRINHNFFATMMGCKEVHTDNWLHTGVCELYQSWNEYTGRFRRVDQSDDAGEKITTTTTTGRFPSQLSDNQRPGGDELRSNRGGSHGLRSKFAWDLPLGEEEFLSRIVSVELYELDAEDSLDLPCGVESHSLTPETHYHKFVGTQKKDEEKEGAGAGTGDPIQSSAAADPVQIEHACESRLVGGELGVVCGRMYTSLTGFRRKSHAGRLQLLTLHALLLQQGFLAWDLGMVMPYKLDMGAVVLETADWTRLVELSSQIKNDLFTIADPPEPIFCRDLLCHYR